MSQAISNTSPLTNLAIVGLLDLVKTQLGVVAVPEAVWLEMLALPHRDGRSALLAARTAGWLQVVVLKNAAMAASLRLEGLDEGEAEAIALAVETRAPLLLIDEKKGRTAARRLGIPVAGALAIVATARKTGAIISAKAQIDRLRAEAGFFVSAEVEAHTLRLAGEI
jgi:predicted nucleic acid-binding protein